MKCDKFETPLNKFCLQAIPQYTVYSWKSETETRPWLIIWKIFLFKSFFIFLVFSLSLHKCRKSLSKTTLMSLNWKVLTGWESLHQRNNSFREHNTLLSKHMQPSSFYTYNTAHAEHRWPLWYNDRIFSYQQKSWSNQSINQSILFKVIARD